MSNESSHQMQYKFEVSDNRPIHDSLHDTFADAKAACVEDANRHVQYLAHTMNLHTHFVKGEHPAFGNTPAVQVTSIDHFGANLSGLPSYCIRVTVNRPDMDPKVTIYEVFAVDTSNAASER